VISFLVGLGFEVSGYNSVRVGVAVWSVGGVWLLVAILPSVVKRFKKNPEIITGKAVSLVGSATISATGTVIPVKTSLWSAGAAESEVLHELYPNTRGVLLWCRHSKGAPLGKYLCEVTFEAKTATAREFTPKTDGRLDCVYPADFEDAPTLPLKDGEYEVEWFREVGSGVGRESIVKSAFERKSGKLRRDWEH
jgi:hypothetical protein